MAQEKCLAACPGLLLGDAWRSSGYCEPKVNFWSCLNDDVVASLSGPEIRGREGKTDIEEQPKVKIKLVVFPPRWNDVRGRLEIGVADRRLDALIEEDRVRASSMPVWPEVRRLTLNEPESRSQASQLLVMDRPVDLFCGVA